MGDTTKKMKNKLNILILVTVILLFAGLLRFSYSTQADLSQLRHAIRGYYGQIQPKLNLLEAKVTRLEEKAKGDSGEQIAKELFKKFIDELEERLK